MYQANEKKKKTERTRIHRPTFRSFWYPSLHLIEDRPGSQKCLPSSFHKYMYLYKTLASFHTRNCYLSFWRGKVQKSRQYNIAPTAVLHNVCASHCSYCYHIGLTLITVSDIKSCDILSFNDQHSRKEWKCSVFAFIRRKEKIKASLFSKTWTENWFLVICAGFISQPQTYPTIIHPPHNLRWV